MSLLRHINVCRQHACASPHRWSLLHVRILASAHCISALSSTRLPCAQEPAVGKGINNVHQPLASLRTIDVTRILSVLPAMIVAAA